jgi:hypothetical protein
MARRIKPYVEEVSLAINPANKKRFFLFKETNMDLTQVKSIILEKDSGKRESLIKTMLKERIDLFPTANIMFNLLNDKATDDVYQNFVTQLNTLIGTPKVEIPIQPSIEDLKKDLEINLRKEIKEELEKESKISPDFKLLKDQVSQMQKDLKSTQETLEKERKDNTETKTKLRKAEVKEMFNDFEAIGDLDKMVERFVKLEKLDKESAQDYLEGIKENAKMFKESGFSSEIGSSGVGSKIETSDGKIMILAKEEMKKDVKLTLDKAIQSVLRANPELYKEHTKTRPNLSV